jgi:phosphate:Na+ symporter
VDSSSFWTLIGGVGLFLLGMTLMTDGLMSAGTRALRRLVSRITRSRWAGLATGIGVTAVVQSSSATTLVTVSFVSAGLVTFQQSIAVMLGANIGTTSTAWIVSLVGFKMDSAAFALPAIGIGALIRLVSRGRRRALGMAIAGFGLVFLGIDFLQAGMQTVSASIRPEDIAIDGLLGTLALVGIGIVMTVVMQSSSAAAATTLAAVHAGSIGFEQAAALVIGQNIGTTVTAIIGAVGGTLAAKRAAAAHVTFNVATGIVAIAALGPFTLLVHELGEELFVGTPEGYVALFHTAFNVLGVVIFLPLLKPFAKAVMRIVPEREDPATRRLTKTALQTPALAVEVARLTCMDLGGRAIHAAVDRLGRQRDAEGSNPNLIVRAARMVREPRRLLTGEDSEHATHEARVAAVARGLDALRAYLGKIGHLEAGSAAYQEYLAVMYASDHVQRIVDAMRNERRLQSLALDPAIGAHVERMSEAMVPVADALAGRSDTDRPQPGAQDDDALAALIDALRDATGKSRVVYRAHILARTAGGELSPADADDLLDTNRWLVDIAHAASRIAELLVWPKLAARELADAPSGER